MTNETRGLTKLKFSLITILLKWCKTTPSVDIDQLLKIKNYILGTGVFKTNNSSHEVFQMTEVLIAEMFSKLAIIYISPLVLGNQPLNG